MAIIYKDINLLTQKSSVTGTEKIEVSDTEYITPSQIAGLSPTKVYEIHPTTFDYSGIYAALPAGFYYTVLDEVEDGLIPIIRVIIPDNGGVLDMQFIAYFEYQQTLSFSGTTSKQEYCFQIGNVDGFWTNRLQKELVSGTNIKTINNQSLLGSGNITISGGGGDTLWEAGNGTNSIQVVNSEGDASGNYSSVEGKGSVTGGSYTENTLVWDSPDVTPGSYSHAEGRYTIACGAAGSHAEGNRTLASGNMSHAENNLTIASGSSSHAEGYNNRAIGGSAHVEGQASQAVGTASHAECGFANAVGDFSHAELGNAFFTISITGAGNATTYTVVISDADIISLYKAVDNTIFEAIIGKSRIAKSGNAGSTITQITQVNSVSFQNNVITVSLDVEKTLSNTALSDDSTYRINYTMAYGQNSHSEGSVSYGYYSHAEGEIAVAVGRGSHAEGNRTIAQNKGEHAEGWYNVSNKASDTYGNAGNTQHSIGIGSNTESKNAVEVMQNGDVYVYGVGGYDGTNISQADTLQDVVGGGGSTTDCVHITGDESVGGDKTFTDNIAVVDASHILYSGASPSQGFTRGESAGWTGAAANSYTITGLEGEPKAFVIGISLYNLPATGSQAVLCVVGDSTGCHGVYTTGTQHNYSSGFTTSYSNGTFTITAPTGVVFNDGYYGISYYYGSGTLTFKTTTVTPGSGVTAVTFTGTSLTEMPVMYAAMLETQVNSESYRRVALYTDSCYEGDAAELESLGITFFSQQVAATTSSFSVSYNNGLYINSGGTNAGGYFHNPGTYTLYYLMASDIGGGGGGSYSDLADELSDIKSDITALETGKQDTLVSGTSIKTINSTSLLGSGNINIASLPTVTTTNNGQILEVSNGAWAAGRTITISSSEPTAYQGNNGDIWIVI